MVLRIIPALLISRILNYSQVMLMWHFGRFSFSHLPRHMLCYTTPPSTSLATEPSTQGRSGDLGGQAHVLKCTVCLPSLPPPSSPPEQGLQPPKKLGKQKILVEHWGRSHIWIILWNRENVKDKKGEAGKNPRRARLSGVNGSRDRTLDPEALNLKPTFKE